jgi:glutamine amidotransferase PdxT
LGSDDERHRMLALAADVEKIQQVMSELEVLENLLRNEDESHVSSKSIELKASIKKLMTDSQVLESLNRLELEGQPVWGLSTGEREMIIMARETVNDC